VTDERFAQEPGKSLKDFLARDDTWIRGRDGKLINGSDPAH
jgi:hypothetical protein